MTILLALLHLLLEAADAAPATPEEASNPTTTKND